MVQVQYRYCTQRDYLSSFGFRLQKGKLLFPLSYREILIMCVHSFFMELTPLHYTL